MKQEKVVLPEIKLIGITARTNNDLEANPSTAKISPTVQHYFQNNLSFQIPHRKRPGITLCAYTDYESDFTGDYTYFIGEEVTSFDGLPESLKTLSIEAQAYAKLTVGPGPMPDIVIKAWQRIWRMTSADFQGQRRYTTDFEVYDERAQNPQNTILDIYIGINE